MLTRIERRLFLAALILLAVAYAFPLWEIQIWAPQYPEGLAMQIGIDRIGGNIGQINILNHYIGMKAITPESIPELSILPKALAVVLALAAVVGLARRRWAIQLWFIGYVIVGLAGLADFYRWGYNYGHDLNPDAPIKVPGMTYQPPLFGHKKILNIDAYSYPDWGGIALGVAGAIAFYVAFAPLLHKLWRTWRARRLSRGAAQGVIAAIFLAVGLVNCTAKPVPLVVGTDNCDHCKMSISDARFGGEVITRKGRVIKFDAITCLARYVSSNRDQVRTVLVSDFFKPGSLVEVHSAVFLRSPDIHGPMGQDVAASAESAAVDRLKNANHGELLQWDAWLGSYLVSSR